MISLLDGACIQAIGWTLLHSLWQGAACAAILAMALRIAAGASASVRYALACGTLASVTLLAIVTFLHLNSASASLPDASAYSSVPTLHASGASSPPHLRFQAAAQPSRSQDSIRVIVLVWAAGVLAMALRHLGGWILLAHLRRRAAACTQLQPVVDQLRGRLGIRGRIDIRCSARFDSPVVAGVLRPVILVPLGVLNALTPQQIESILAHELAHVRRHDCLVNLIQVMIEAMMFYHPAVWWITAQIRREREHCCDDVAAACGDPISYARALAALEELRAPAPLALAARSGDLLARVRRLLGHPSATRTAPAPFLIVVLILFALSAQLLAPQHHAQAQSEPAAPRIAPGQPLKVTIQDLNGPGIETEVRQQITNDGRISLPLVGSVKLDGMRFDEAEAAIAKAYADAEILQDASVSVTQAEHETPKDPVNRGTSISLQHRLKSLYSRLDELELQRSALKRSYQDSHKLVLEVEGLIKDVKQRIAELEEKATTQPSSDAAAPRPTLRIVVGPDWLQVAGERTTWEDLDQQLAALPEAQRRRTVLELTAASADVPVGTYFDAQAVAARLAQKHRLGQLILLGIDPKSE